MTKVAKRIWDDWNRTVGDVRYNNGVNAGIRIGVIIGINIGVNTGVETVARTMFACGDDEDFVKQRTGLSQEKIDEILGRKKEKAQNPEEHDPVPA